MAPLCAKCLDGCTRIPNHFFAAPGQGHNDRALKASVTHSFIFVPATTTPHEETCVVPEPLHSATSSNSRLPNWSTGKASSKGGTASRLTKRKRDGVYYPPEWVVNLLVENTLEPWFAAARLAAGYDQYGEEARPGAAKAYLERVKAIRIVDPACGSGAFLISAFRRLLNERMAAERAVAANQSRAVAPALDEPELIRDILANNIYGVDINPASVEITKLALWLHSARAKSPLSSLDHTIRCGNSLVGPDFWSGREALRDREDRVNCFDWKETFPEVWPNGEEGGFDIVLGNPPYVKLQNLMKVDPEIVGYLCASRSDDTYATPKRQHRPVPSLHRRAAASRARRPDGIAPSLWTVNDTERLRRTSVAPANSGVDRFQAYQVYDEAITIQPSSSLRANRTTSFASPQRREAKRRTSTGSIQAHARTMPEDGAWLMAIGPEGSGRRLAISLRLDDPSLTTGIVVGIRRADAIITCGGSVRRYLCSPKAARHTKCGSRWDHEAADLGRAKR